MKYVNNCKQYRQFIYLHNPSTCTNIRDLSDADRYAKQNIHELESIIEDLKEHRLELAKRVQELKTMRHHTKVVLKRIKNESGNLITYHISTFKVYEDGTEQKIEYGEFIKYGDVISLTNIKVPSVPLEYVPLSVNKAEKFIKIVEASIEK